MNFPIAPRTSTQRTASVSRLCPYYALRYAGNPAWTGDSPFAVSATSPCRTRRLYNGCAVHAAGVAELADAQDLGSCGRKAVGVQLPPPALCRRSNPRKGVKIQYLCGFRRLQVEANRGKVRLIEARKMCHSVPVATVVWVQFEQLLVELSSSRVQNWSFVWTA